MVNVMLNYHEIRGVVVIDVGILVLYEAKCVLIPGDS